MAKWKKVVVWRGPNGAIELFKVSEGSWERYADGDGVGKATLVAHRDNLLAVGGLEGGVYTTKVRRFRIEKKTNKQLSESDIPDMLVGCGQSCVVSDRDHLVVMGGCGAKGILLDTVQVYSHVTKPKAWSLGCALPTPCAGGSAIVYQGSIILLGGNHMGSKVWYAKISELEVSHLVHG